MAADRQYDIEYLPAAVRDISHIIAAFAALSGKSSALRIKSVFDKKAQSISLFPYSAIPVPIDSLAKKGFHMAIAEDYLMIYRVFESESKVIFYRVLNGRTDYTNVLIRIKP